MTFMPLLMISACSGVNSGGEEPEALQGAEGPSIALRIGAMGTRTSGNNISEKIKTLRIIMLSDGFIETIRFIDYEKAEGSTTGVSDADIFTQKFDHITVAGNKKFYLIANEESVAELKFDEDIELPGWWEEGMSLKDLLGHYSKDILPSEGTLGTNGSGSGEELERLLSAAYFTPDYTVANNTIYLPYTAMYDNIKATNDMSVKITKNMYLLPVATKFTFNMINYRDEEVDIKGITIGRVNSGNFLMARLADNEKTKKLDGIDYYWIEWLEKVVRDTHSAYDDGEKELGDYNASAGWIKDYYAPEASSLVNYVAKPGEGTWKVSKTTDKDDPEKLSVEFYCPESINTGSPSEDDPDIFEEGDDKIYFVRFEIQEKSANTSTVSEWMQLSALPALFRCTHLIVDVDMYQSLVKIYCEMAPWDVWTFQGFVKEEED